MKNDVIIIGGGHNGLVAAFYLAKAGFKPLVLERRPVVGGAAVTDEVHPGFKYSTLSHAAGPLVPQIARDMDLGRHGLETVHPDSCVFAPLPDGRHLLLRRDPRESAAEIAAFSDHDARRYADFLASLERIGPVLASLLSRTPPSVDRPTIGDLWKLLKSARTFRSLERADAYRLLRWIPMPAADLASEWFDSEPLRAVVAARGIFGAFLGPRSPGSGAVMLLQSALGSGMNRITFVRGGLGSLGRALAEAARQAGADIRTDAPVAHIKVREGEATGVALASGEEIDSRAVVSNADPRRTFLDLVEPIHFDPTFVAKIRNYRCAGTVAKVNLALAALPRFSSLRDSGAGPEAHAALSGRIHLGPDTDYLERAFDEAKYGSFSSRPWLDAAIPSITDPSLAPAGAHVMSVYVQFAPYALKGGDWRNRRDDLGDTVVRELARHAPNLPELILHRQVLTPLDLEETYGLTGGHIYHGELALDQLFTMRPLYGWAQYRTPVRRLYLCGAGTSPGGGLNGASGANASREIIRDLR